MFMRRVFANLGWIWFGSMIGYYHSQNMTRDQIAEAMLSQVFLVIVALVIWVGLLIMTSPEPKDEY